MNPGFVKRMKLSVFFIIVKKRMALSFRDSSWIECFPPLFNRVYGECPNSSPISRYSGYREAEN